MRALKDKIYETFNWFTKADLGVYKGRYVSVVDSSAVDADDYTEEAYKIAEKKYSDKEVVLWKVPHDETFIFLRNN